MCLWRVSEDGNSVDSECSVSPMHSLQVPEYEIMTPLSKLTCLDAEKFRALAYNETVNELAALSLNGRVHVWDAQRLKSVSLVS